MRITIACPPLMDFYATPHRSVPLGPELLRKKLIERGHSVTILNFPITGRPRTVALPYELSYLKPFLLSRETGGSAFFTGYRRFGPDFPECARIIAESQPDLLCISSFAYAYAEEAILLARAVKERDPGLFVLAGGAGPSAWPGRYLVTPGIDAVLAGDAGEALPLFVERLFGNGRQAGVSESGDGERFSGIPGLSFREGDSIRETPRPDEPPGEPDPVIAYAGLFRGRVYYSVSVARGCVKNCRFCSNHIVWGRKFRPASLTRIDAEITRAVRAASLSSAGAGPQPRPHFNFEDDNLLIDPGWFFSVIDIFRRRFPKATFSAENGLDYGLLTPAHAERLARAGFTQCNLSLVSASARIRDGQGRDASADAFAATVRALASRGIPVISYFIAGFPEDDRQSVAHTLARLAALPVTVGISPFYALPGITGYEDREFFRDRPPRLSLGSSLYPWSGSLSVSTLVTAFRIARLVNLMKNPRSAEEQGIVSLFLREQRLFTVKRVRRERKIFRVPECDEELVRLFFRERGRI